MPSDRCPAPTRRRTGRAGPALVLLTLGVVVALAAAPTLRPGAVLAQDAGGATLAELEQLEASLTPVEKADIQRVLATLGHYDGPIDALFGGGTREAIRRFQASLGALETGYLTAEQIRLIQDGSAAALTGAGDDAAGNRPASAADLGTLRAALVAADRVGVEDREDFWRFNVPSRQTVTVTLAVEGGDADVALLAADGALVALSNRAGTAAEAMQASLDAGDYLVQVSHFEGTAAYDLQIRPAAAPHPDLVAWEGEWTREERRRVEHAFALIGYLSGGVDGFFGARTREAITAFQLAAGTPPTGYLTLDDRVRLAVEAAEAAAARGQETAAAAAARAEAARAVADRAPPSGFEGYRGEVVNGRRQGLGVFAWEDGDRYEGEFAGNRRHGLGVQQEADGDRYAGAFVDEDRRGFGAFSKPDGRVWRGEFLDGPFEGFGVFTSTDGFRVAGEWRRTGNGGWSFTGYGEQVRPGEAPRRGRWEESELIEPL